MAGIEKLVTNGIQIASQATQKAGCSAQKGLQIVPLEKFDGLNALANQKMPFVQLVQKPVSAERTKINCSYKR